MVLSKKQYFTGLVIVFASVYSQYLFVGIDSIFSVLLVYGIPTIVISLLWGSEIIRGAFRNTFTALKYGLGLFGAFTVLGILIATIILLVLIAIEPSALDLLQTPNPALRIESEFAWIMVLFSVLVIGPVEEYIFTGFIYGGLLRLFKDHHWLGLAVISSIMFSVVHLYYAFAYELISLILFSNLMTFSMAMAATYYFSGGNLFIPALIHGAYDAMGFISVATSLSVGILLRGSFILLSIIVALFLFLQKITKRKAT